MTSTTWRQSRRSAGVSTGSRLAIELAAARMAAMSPQEVRNRLDDRFRLLSGGRRGSGASPTLRQAVQWSFDLLTAEERGVLGCCSVFADGFELAAISAVYGSDDEYSMLDLMDSLVRKSLVTVNKPTARPDTACWRRSVSSPRASSS